MLIFLGAAITATILKGNSTSISSGDIMWVEEDVSLIQGATQDEVQLDRQSIIDRLRAKLALNEERIEPVPSVEAPVEPEEPLAVGKLQRCLYLDDALSIVPRWPLQDVGLEITGMSRVVYHTETIPTSLVQSSSSDTVLQSVSTKNKIALLAMPASPQQLQEPSCVPSEVVGVTTQGVLIFNGNVGSYRQVPPDTLIGYARDGFPIYGTYQGEVDACGGYSHPAGYRYTISKERNYILGCYIGTPASFTL